MGKGQTVVEKMRGRHQRVRYDSTGDITTLFEELDQEIQVPIIKGDPDTLPPAVKKFIAEHVQLCRPKGVYICDGSKEEADEITEKMVNRGLLQKLDKYENCFLYGYHMYR